MNSCACARLAASIALGRRTERWRSGVSCVTMPTEARRLSWVTDVLVVDQNAALLKIVEAQEQADERRFSGSRPADEADFLAWPYRKRKSIDDPRRVGAGSAFCAAIVESDGVEADLALCYHQRFRPSLIHNRLRS